MKEKIKEILYNQPALYHVELLHALFVQSQIEMLEEINKMHYSQDKAHLIRQKISQLKQQLNKE